ncbi:putative PEX26 peroxisomal biogenesis factor 26 [Triangularia setosa]|uniref:PEX26 peroxisomal biogenesis factor 26 n=1 Tax=Triangularia setosa TaxID=2587417 RepID=A0AAN7A8I3_9PEZI|nr:putative PEX26 peroxisomal biogenesis factor 26 [Podospora setosa]
MAPSSNRSSYVGSEPNGNGNHTNLLSTSISSLSSSMNSPRPSSSSSHITKTYRQASTLFLTRRLPEALSTVLPLVSPVPQTENDPNGPFDPAPTAKASRSSRIKVWSLYLTILNAILELDSEEGKAAFGTAEWRALCHKVRDGEIWEEVVKNGYHGVEGDVDADVVINLATILLAHAKTQTFTQTRLETYLSYSPSPLPTSLDFSRSSSRPAHLRERSNSIVSRNGGNGTDTPRDLASRLKLLELYTLHVLPRNQEWVYAKEFISVSPILDEERREAFLQALESLQEEQKEMERIEEERRKENEERIKRDIEEARRLRAENEERERKRLEEERQRREREEKERKEKIAGKKKGKVVTEGDFGLDDGASSVASGTSSSGTAAKAAKRKGGLAKVPPSSVKKGGGGGAKMPVGGPSGPGKPRRGSDGTMTLANRATMVLGNLKGVVDQIAAAWQMNPFAMYRFLAFIIGLVVVFGRKKTRERVMRMMSVAWGKVAATAGMGTKVSYI